jgi:hypothetical protein
MGEYGRCALVWCVATHQRLTSDIRIGSVELLKRFWKEKSMVFMAAPDATMWGGSANRVTVEVCPTVFTPLIVIVTSSPTARGAIAPDPSWRRVRGVDGRETAAADAARERAATSDRGDMVEQ